MTVPNVLAYKEEEAKVLLKKHGYQVVQCKLTCAPGRKPFGTVRRIVRQKLAGYRQVLLVIAIQEELKP